MFRAVFPSIIRSQRMYILQQAHVKLAGTLARRQQYLFDICLLQYIQSITPDDGRKDLPTPVECFSNKINLRH